MGRERALANMIEFVDGNTNTVLQRVPFDQVPPGNREVYLRDGERVSSAQEADEIVPIARVVRLLVDDAGAPAEPEHATRAMIQEFDASGVLLRETLQLRSR
ncbi:hypothetical protein D3C87_772090 [compost metagenome]